MGMSVRILPGYLKCYLKQFGGFVSLVRKVLLRNQVLREESVLRWYLEKRPSANGIFSQYFEDQIIIGLFFFVPAFQLKEVAFRIASSTFDPDHKFDSRWHYHPRV